MTELTHILLDPAHWLAEGVMDSVFLIFTSIPAYFIGKRRVKKHDEKVTGEDLHARVEQIQDRHWALRENAMAAVVGLIDDLKAAKAAGRNDSDLLAARYLQRRSQFYLDFDEAENSTGFHAPQEAARILGESLDFAREHFAVTAP